MRAIIVAAGMGRRLAPYTDDRPKCLVDVNGRSILERQLDAYRAAGVDDVVIVRGYRKESIAVPGARYFDNDAYRDNNILCSLFYAEPAMDDEFLFSYSDIVFRPEVVRAALETPGDYALVIDRLWHEAYVGRVNHPVEEGEVARVDGGRVTLVGKKTMPPSEASGEFIGLARFSKRAAEKMRERFHARRRELAGKPYGRAPRFESAYLTDLLNDLISTGEVMRPAFIDGGWREIDTVEDLERAKIVVSWT
ncbi:MAG TPA: phosphocholine cytidylyltransferase family protein [Polyangia bacterium]|nr:phosphocholine cytidylyltransferase family protein [Polyangia bacterium]